MAVWRKAVYPGISKNFINFPLSGDYYFWMELSACGDVFISGKLLNYFRYHDQNISFSASKNGLGIKEQLLILQELLEKRTISETDYLTALKKIYLEFRFHKKTMLKEDIAEIKGMLNKNSKNRFPLHLYHFQKSMQRSLKKMLHT
jgi:hypothetical protein